MVSLVGLFANPETRYPVLTDTVSQLGPASAAETFQEPIESLTSNRGTAGVMFIVGVVSALWSASGYVSAFADACNSIYEVEEGRPFWKLKPLSSLVTFVLILLAAIVALALVLSGPSSARSASRSASAIRSSPSGASRSGRRWCCSCS